MSKKIDIVGGHGKKDIKDVHATPLVLSLEDSSVANFSKAFKGAEIVYFSAGAGGKGGKERTKKVDYEGAVKVFDAIEGIEGKKPRLILVSAFDIRDPEKIPAHYNKEDIAVSNGMRKDIPAYIQCKYEVDKNLVKRTAFKWTILRPGFLSNDPGTGTASIGRTHLTPPISRDDVAKVLALLGDREGAAGLAIDFVGGTTPIGEGLDAFIKKGETDFLG